MVLTDQTFELVSKKSVMNKHFIFLTIGGYNTQLVIILHEIVYIMNDITTKPLDIIFITIFLALSSLNPALAEEVIDEEMTDKHAQTVFDIAMQERDSGKIYDAIEKFEYILSRRPSLNRARLELAVSYHRASQYDDAM